MESYYKKIIASIVVAGTLAFGANEITKEKPNVKDYQEAKTRVQMATSTLADVVISEEAPIEAKLYLWANVTKQGRGTVKIIK